MLGYTSRTLTFCSRSICNPQLASSVHNLRQMQTSDAHIEKIVVAGRLRYLSCEEIAHRSVDLRMAAHLRLWMGDEVAQ